MNRYLALLLAFSAPVHAAPIPAAAPKPITLAPSEIALRGTIESLNANEMRVIVSSFRLPNGKTSPISPPKTKTVSLANTKTRFKELKIGQQIEVIGRDTGSGKPLIERAISVLSGFVDEAVAPEKAVAPPVATVPITSPAQPTLPVETKVEGWTFRVEEAAFATTILESDKGRPFYKTPHFQAPVICIAPDGTKQKPANFRAEILSPSGAPLENEEVNPNWPFVWVDISARDAPKTSDAEDKIADGERLESVEFSVAKPKVGEPLKLDLKAKTASGVEVELSEIGFQNEGGSPQISLKANWKPSPELLDARVGLATFGDLAILDDKGEPIFGGGSRQGGYAGVTSWTIRPSELPSGETWKLRMTFQIVERAKATGKRIGARLKIPVDAVPQAPFGILGEAIEASNAQVEARIEADAFAWNELWSGTLWTRDLKEPTTRTWEIEQAFQLAPGGEKKQIWPQTQPRTAPFYGDGTPALNGSRQTGLSFIFDPKQRPKTFDFQMALRAKRVFDSSFALQVPLPEVDADFDLDVATDSSAPFTLKRVVRFDPRAPLAAPSKANLPLSGLALVFEVEPYLPDGWMWIRLQWARDNLNRPLGFDAGSQWQDGDLTVDGPTNPKRRTLILSRPAPDAQSISIGATAHEQKDDGEKTTVEFRGAPVPDAPKQ